jgi:hypothetical protein
MRQTCYPTLGTQNRTTLHLHTNKNVGMSTLNNLRENEYELRGAAISKHVFKIFN